MKLWPTDLKQVWRDDSEYRHLWETFSAQIRTSWNKVRGSSMTLGQWPSTFHGLWPPSKDSQPLCPPARFAISRQSYLEKASARGPRTTAPWAPRLRNPVQLSPNFDCRKGLLNIIDKLV